MASRRVLPWMAGASTSGGTLAAQPAHPAWAALQSGLTDRRYVQAAEALQALLEARQNLGPLSPKQAQLVTATLSLAASDSLVAQLCAVPCLALLSRWVRQVTTPVTASTPATRQQLQDLVQLVMHHSTGPRPATARSQAATILFLGTAFAGCSPEQQQQILQSVCENLLRGVTEVSGDLAANPLSSLSSCYDTCFGCELILRHISVLPASPGQQHPALTLLSAITQGVTATAHALVLAATQDQPPNIAFHAPAPPPVLLPQPAWPGAGPVTAAQHPTSQPPPPPPPPSRTSALLDAGVLGRSVALQVAARMMAAVGAAAERWGSDTARGLAHITPAQLQAVRGLLQQLAVQLQSEGSRGLQAALQSPSASGSPAVEAGVSGGSAGSGGVRAAPAGVGWMASAAVFLGVQGITHRYVQPVVLAQLQQPPPQPAQRAPGTRVRGALQSGCALLCSAGLLKGLVLGLKGAAGDRQLHNRAALTSELQPQLAAFTASVQSALAAVCRHQQELQRGPRHPAHQLLRWCCGLVHGDLTAALEASGLLHLVAVPGPLAARLPAMVCEALLDVALSTEPLLLAACQHQPPGAAAAYLREHTESDAFFLRVPAMARCVVRALQDAQLQQHQDAGSGQPPRDMARDVLDMLQAGACAAAHVYGALVLTAPPGWMQQLSPPPPAPPAPLRSVLDKLYVSVVAALPPAAHAVSAGLPADTRAQAAARALAAAASVSFCAVQLDALSQPLAALVPLAVSSPAGASELLAALPCYADLIQPVTIHDPTATAAAAPAVPQGPGSRSNAGPAGTAPNHAAVAAEVSTAPRWEVDLVLAAQLASLLPVLTAAACAGPSAPRSATALARDSPPTTQHRHPAAAQQAADSWATAERLLPTLFLLLKHPQGALAAKAHACIGPLAAHLAEKGHVERARQTLPYYVQRSLQTPWTLEQLEGFEKTFPQVLHALPVGCSEAMYALQYVIQQAVQWYSVNCCTAPVLDFTPLYLRQPPQLTAASPEFAPGLSQPSPQALTPAAKLMSVVAGLLLVVDWQLVPEVASMVAQVVAAAGLVPPASPASAPSTKDLRRSHGAVPGDKVPQQVALLQLLHDMILRSDDYVRKPGLMEWFQGLLGAHHNSDHGVAGSKQAWHGEQQTGWTLWRRMAGWLGSNQADMNTFSPAADLHVELA